MLVAQLSDPHIVEAGEWMLGSVDTASAFARAIQHVNELRDRPDLVLLTGDLVNDGLPSQYEHLGALLAALEVPFWLMPGNHDHTPSLRKAFPDDVPGVDGRADGVRDGDVRIVAVDSTRFPEPGGTLDDDQLHWLHAVLSEQPGTPTMVALHHPPFDSGLRFMDTMRLDAGATEALESVVSRHPQVERVLCGHLHRGMALRFAGTIAMSCPGSAHSLELGFGDGPTQWNEEPSSLLLHRWTPGSGLVTHSQVIGRHNPHSY